MNLIPLGGAIGETGLRVARIVRRDAAVRAARALRESRFDCEASVIQERLDEFRAAFNAMRPQADWSDVQDVKDELHMDDDLILNIWAIWVADKFIGGAS